MNQYSSIIEGLCHCGNISFEFKTVFTPDTLIVRRCQCDFCRAHGAATARDPDGMASIKARESDAVTLYRFGTRTTDFILCAKCGVYIGATVANEQHKYATLNMNITTLDIKNAGPMACNDELGAIRIAQRIKLFTPLAHCPF